MSKRNQHISPFLGSPVPCDFGRTFTKSPDTIGKCISRCRAPHYQKMFEPPKRQQKMYNCLRRGDAKHCLENL